MSIAGWMPARQLAELLQRGRELGGAGVEAPRSSRRRRRPSGAPAAAAARARRAAAGRRRAGRARCGAAAASAASTMRTRDVRQLGSGPPRCATAWPTSSANAPEPQLACSAGTAGRSPSTARSEPQTRPSTTIGAATAAWMPQRAQRPVDALGLDLVVGVHPRRRARLVHAARRAVQRRGRSADPGGRPSASARVPVGDTPTPTAPSKRKSVDAVAPNSGPRLVASRRRRSRPACAAGPRPSRRGAARPARRAGGRRARRRGSCRTPQRAMFAHAPALRPYHCGGGRPARRRAGPGRRPLDARGRTRAAGGAAAVLRPVRGDRRHRPEHARRPPATAGARRARAGPRVLRAPAALRVRADAGRAGARPGHRRARRVGRAARARAPTPRTTTSGPSWSEPARQGQLRRTVSS